MSNPPFAFGQYQPAAQFDMNRITANVAKMREQGAPDEDVEHYLQNVEGLQAPQPETPTGPRSTYDVNDAVVHGLTRGWSEKGAAKIWADIDKLKGEPGSYDELYQHDLDQRNAARQAYLTGSPTLNTVGETVGGAIPYGYAGAAGLLRTPATLLGKAALGGAITGAERGLSAGAEAPPGEELPAMARGAAVGTGVGAVAYPVLGALGDRLAKSSLGSKVLSAANTGLGMLTGEDAAVSPMLQSSPQGRALAALQQHPAFADQGALESQAANAEEPTTLARLGNRKLVPGLLKQAATESPEALGRFGAVAGAAKEAADPLYAAARSQTVTLTPELRQALDNPILAHAYETGRNIASTEGVTLPAFPAGVPEDAMARTAKDVGRAFGGASSPADIARTMSPSQLALPGNEIFRDALKGSDELPVQGLDYMKRGLDKLIQQGQAGQYTIDNTAARALRGRLNDVLDLVDQQVPEYGKARATAAVYKQLEPAILAGQQRQGAQLLAGPKATNTPSAWEMASAAEGHPYGQVSLASRLFRGPPPMSQVGGPLANLLTMGSQPGELPRLQALVRALGRGQAATSLPALLALRQVNGQ